MPIDDLIEDLEKHLCYEINFIPNENKDGYEWATNDALIHLSNYKLDGFEFKNGEYMKPYIDIYESSAINNTEE